MKFLIFRKFSWLILFTLIHLWFMVFNWQLFITMLNVKLGFGVVRMPAFLVLFLIGFGILAIQSWIGYVNKLHRIIHDLEKELTRQKKDLQSSRNNGPGAERLTGNKTGSRTEGLPGSEQSPGSDGNQKKPSEIGERK